MSALGRRGASGLVGTACKVAPLVVTLVLTTFALVHKAGNNVPRLQDRRRLALADGVPPAAHTPVFVSYAAAGGAANQLLGHVNALAVGNHLNATLVTSAAQSRKNSTMYKRGLTKYDRQGVDTMVDFAGMQQYWADKGVGLRKEADLAMCATHHLVNHTHRMNITTLAFYPAEVALFTLRGIIRNLMRIQPRPPSWPYQLPAARGLFFPPRVQQAADAVLKAMAEISGTTFFGLHLRVEDDFVTYARNILRDSQSPLLSKDPVRAYIQRMRAAGFTNSTPVYVASGLFVAKPPKAIEQLERRFKEQGVLAKMHHKLALLPPEQLQGFHSEQLALIDLLVLLKSQVLVGDAASSFSAFVREFRAVQGISKDTFVSVVEYPPPFPCQDHAPCINPNFYDFAPYPHAGSEAAVGSAVAAER
ncbi:hypothetical protein N2152v2_010854 [Parachlorella kessleri]